MHNYTLNAHSKLFKNEKYLLHQYIVNIFLPIFDIIDTLNYISMAALNSDRLVLSIRLFKQLVTPSFTFTRWKNRKNEED